MELRSVVIPVPVVSTNLTIGSPGFGTFTDVYTRQTLGCTTACVSARFIEPISLDVSSVPEPNSLLSILTLGIFGAGSAIKRKQSEN